MDKERLISIIDKSGPEDGPVLAEFLIEFERMSDKLVKCEVALESTRANLLQIEDRSRD
jgi:hypothetical protein